PERREVVEGVAAVLLEERDLAAHAAELLAAPVVESPVPVDEGEARLAVHRLQEAELLEPGDAVLELLVQRAVGVVAVVEVELRLTVALRHEVLDHGQVLVEGLLAGIEPRVLDGAAVEPVALG